MAKPPPLFCSPTVALTKVTAVWSDLRSVIFILGGGDIDNQWLLKRVEKANISDRHLRARKILVWSDLQKRFSKPFSQSWMENNDKKAAENIIVR